jgi:dolichol-phosphate mannosyltransferase
VTTASSVRPLRLAVVIPCYRVRDHVLEVIARIPPAVHDIFCVDDCCPDDSGSLIERTVTDPRVRVIRNAVNLGVGGATMAGYRAALAAGADVVVKVDGDGQMNPLLIPGLVRPILTGSADYTKGNRFYEVESVSSMPKGRIFGNAVLTFFAKASTGYWRTFDPTNGFTAIHVSALRRLPLEKISRRYFFESDMLFRLNTVRAVVLDVPMEAVYGSERSNLRISAIVLPFLLGHFRNTLRRFAFNYLLRDFSIASTQALIGVPALAFGVVFGAVKWSESIASGVPASAGTVMVSALPLIVGLQLLLAALGYDIASVPTTPLQRFDVPEE